LSINEQKAKRREFILKKYKVICITTGATEPPKPEKIEKAIEAATADGWNFVQFTTGGGGGNGNVISWVYILFELETSID
jgi:hypothetical protein